MKPVKKNSPAFAVNKPGEPITTIIFDFGNVLVVDTEKVFEHMFKLDRLPEVRRVRYEIASHETERGEKPTKHLLQVMKDEFETPLDTHEINEMMVSTKLISPMWNLMQQLRKDYTIAILTNNQKTWPRETVKRLGVSFKGIKVFISANIGSRKPEKESYMHVLKHLKISPKQVLFIDDKQINIDSATDVGIQGIRFTGNMKDVISKLKK